MSTSIKRKATDDLTTRPNKIIRRNINDAEHTTLSDISNFRRQIYRRRRLQIPRLPKNAKEAVALILEKQDKIMTFKKERFVFCDGSIIAVTCRSNLSMLCTPNLSILADGTFKCSPKHFFQLYTVHGFKNGIYMPLVYFFVQNKTEKGYVSMWKFLLSLCEQENLAFTPSSIRLDFEIAAHNAIRTIFPECQILGCRFHLGQSWYRHLRKHFPQLHQEYCQQTETRRWVRQFFGLSFLAPGDIHDAFCELISIAPCEKSCEFADYILDNYVDASATFPPQIWAELPSRTPRTTNGAESFHSHYNSQFYHEHPAIWIVLEILKEIQTETYVKMTECENSTADKRSQKELDKITKVCTAHSQFDSKNISLLEYLNQISYAYLPKDI